MTNWNHLLPGSRRLINGPKKLLGNVPWITKEGYFDPGKFPIDSALKQALSDDHQEFRSGLNLLGSMYSHGRMEAGVFLMGLLVNCDDNWEKRISILEAMTGIDTKPCADLLFGELKRVKSSNTTRRYLGAVIKVLSTMPSGLIEEGFQALAEDKYSAPRCGTSSGRFWRSGSLRHWVVTEKESLDSAVCTLGHRLLLLVVLQVDPHSFITISETRQGLLCRLPT